MMRLPGIWRWSARLLLMLGLSGFIWLWLPQPVVLAASEILEDVRRIGRQLQCPICEGVSVADSPSDLAVQMRGVIRRKLEAGESERQILDYFVQAYGESVLLEPPRRGVGLLVWGGPPLVLGAGVVVLWLVLRSWIRPGSGARKADLASGPRRENLEMDGFENLASRELEAIRRDLGR